MKNTMVTVVLFVFLSFLFSEKTLALVPMEIRDDIRLVVTLVPTSTPTPIIFKKIDPNINLQLISTIAPAAKLTVTPTPTVENKLTVTPGEKTVSPIITQNPTTEPTVTMAKTEEETESKIDIKTLFMGITLGLLVLIIVIQLLPKKKVNQ